MRASGFLTGDFRTSNTQTGRGRKRDTRKRLARAVATAMGIEPLESRRMMSVTINNTVTLDESPGLQTNGTPITVDGVLIEDNTNDNDVALTVMQSEAPSFYNRLFGAPAPGLGLGTTFPTSTGVGKSADNYITVNAGAGIVTNLAFAKDDGTALPVYAGVATGGVASGLTAISGGAISFFADTSAGLGNRMVIGVDTTNQIVLAMFMQPNATLTSAKVWTVQLEPLHNPIAVNNFDDPITAA